jgi:hypothetical protein
MTTGLRPSKAKYILSIVRQPRQLEYNNSTQLELEMCTSQVFFTLTGGHVDDQKSMGSILISPPLFKRLYIL